MVEADVEPVAKPPKKNGGARPGAGRKPTRSQVPPIDDPPSSPVAPQYSRFVCKAEDQAVDFFDYMKSFPPEDWREILNVYLFRTAPITDRVKTGNFKYIQKYFQPPTQEQVMKEFGSGGYKMMFNWYNATSRKTTLIREGNFDIENMDFPPKVPLGEWIDDERNKQWLWAKPALAAQQATAYATTGMGAGMNPATNINDMLKTALDFAKQARPDADEKTLIKMVMEDMRERVKEAKGNPSETVALVKSLAEMMKGGAAAGGGGDPVMAAIIKSMGDQNATLLAAALKQPSFAERMQELKLMKEVFAPERSNDDEPRYRERGTTGWDVARDLGSEALRVLGTVGQIFLARMGAPPPPGTPGTPGTPAAAADAGTTVQAVPQGEMTADQQRDMIKRIAYQWGHVFDSVAPMLVDKFHNADGYAFREWVIKEYGEATYRSLRAFSPQTILGVLEVRKHEAPDQTVKARLAELMPPEDVAAFIEEFLSDDDPEEIPDGDAEPEPAAAQAKRAADSF